MSDQAETPLDRRLPDDEAYWRNLVSTISTSAEPMLMRNEERYGTWWATLARGCPALAAAAGVAAILAGAAWFSAGTSDASPYDGVARAISPTDEVAQTYFTEAAPPRVEALLPVLVGTEGTR